MAVCVLACVLAAAAAESVGILTAPFILVFARISVDGTTMPDTMWLVQNTGMQYGAEIVVDMLTVTVLVFWQKCHYLETWESRYVGWFRANMLIAWGVTCYSLWNVIGM